MNKPKRRSRAGATRTSIRTVAERAGVSTATVSRALRLPDKVSEATRQRVVNAIEELKYLPNQAARNLRTRRANAVILLVPAITNPFFSPIIRSAERVASSRGYSVLLGDTEESAEKELRLAQLALSGEVDGILHLGGRWPAGYPVTEATIARFVSACELFDSPRVSSIAIDNRAAAEEMTEFLVELGHRAIALVTGPASSILTLERLEGVGRALAKVGQTPVSIFAGDYSMQSGADAASAIYEARERATAVFCFNDEMALGAMHRLAELGLQVPRAIGVCGFDDIDVARFCSPALTTMSQPASEIGEQAMTILLDSIEGRRNERVVGTLSAKLVVRFSVLPRDQMT